MSDRIHDAFDAVKAEGALKENTLAFLRGQSSPKKAFPVRRLLVAAASVIVLLAAGIFGYSLYFTDAAYIDIDVNPSIELTLNRFDRVIQTTAYNDDGQAVLDAVNLRHKPYGEALALLIDEMEREGYIQDAGLLSATLEAAGSKKEKALLDEIKAQIDAALSQTEKTVDKNIFTVDEATRTAAHGHRMTPAKYLAITELQTLDPSATFDNCRDHSISELNQKIDDCKSEHGVQSGGSDGEHGGNGNGHGNSDNKHEDGH